MDKSSFVDFEMRNGKVQCTLNFWRLNQLKVNHSKEYKRFFEISKNGMETILDGIEFIYVAYLCANLENYADVMSYDEFLQNCKNSHKRIWDTVAKLQVDEKN